MVSTSSIISIIYFTVNVVFLIIIAIIVYKQGGHKLKSKSYLKDIWSQRRIYTPILVHFYDTATDIGVVYGWYHLMVKEQNNPDINYKSLDMASFFWPGIAFLALYRFTTLLWIVYGLYLAAAEWYELILALFDLLIFKYVYDSFSEAQDVIAANAEIRKEKAAQKKKQKEMKKQMETAIEMKEDTATTTDDQQTKEETEIAPIEDQATLQYLEAAFESMPQIILQSVYVIRSANDEELKRNGSNIYLLLFSIIASLFSITNKFAAADKEMVDDKAKALKPRQECPECVQYWYVIRLFWRMNHQMSVFGVFLLIWAVMGGAWLPIWAGIIWICWIVIYIWNSHRVDEKQCEGTDLLEGSAAACLFILGVFGDKHNKNLFIFKFIHGMIGLSLITLFGILRFECDICSDPDTRQIFNNENERVFIFWTLTLISSILDIALYIIMYINNIWDEE